MRSAARRAVIEVIFISHLLFDETVHDGTLAQEQSCAAGNQVGHAGAASLRSRNRCLLLVAGFGREAVVLKSFGAQNLLDLREKAFASFIVALQQRRIGWAVAIRPPLTIEFPLQREDLPELIFGRSKLPQA